MKKLKNLLLYGGIDKQDFQNVKGLVDGDNKKSVQSFAILATVVFLFTSLITYINKPLASPILYIGAAGGCLLVLGILLIFYKKYPSISSFLAITFSLILLIIGIIIAYAQNQERTTMLLPMFCLVSLVFCYRPIYIVGMTILIEIVYLILMKQVQPTELFYVNQVNTIIFSCFGIISGTYTTVIKYKKFKVEYNNQLLIEEDPLTGLSNRYSWKKELESLVKNPKPVTIMLFDINGLKPVNDNLGHLAGDEVIKGAAQCIDEIFGSIGKVYRMGGDEFCALSYEQFDFSQKKEQLKERTKEWKGSLGQELNISCGMSLLDYDYEQRLKEVIHEADIEMYEEKKQYHLTH